MAEVVTGSPPKAKEEAIAKFLEQKPGFEITNENGQRKYSSIDQDSQPPKGSEVFVGKLPRDVFEDELVPLFEKMGPIHEMRLMMDDSCNNRGFAFVTYTCPEDAKRAIQDLNHYEIRRSRFIGVCKSVDNCRLFVGGIPKSKTKDEILEQMQRVTEGVSKVILYSSIVDKSKNRGFAFVEYESHKAAAAARRKLIPGKVPLFGHDIAVDWAEPEPDVDEETMAKVTILYVRNLMLSTTEDKMREVFSMGGKLSVEKVKKLKDFAFVHYQCREDAEMALHRLNNSDLDDSIVEVTWAKPADRIIRSRCHVRTHATLHPPFLYGPAFESFIPTFVNCPGRGGMLHRIPPFRGRSNRGAAGIRRFRNFVPNPNHPGPFKSSEAGVLQHPPHFVHPLSKLNRLSEKGEQYPHEYVLMPLPPNAEGMDTPIAVSGPPLMTHAPRIPPSGFLYPPPGYDDVSYLYYAQGPVSSY